MKRAGRPSGRTYGAALRACAGVGGKLEALARELLTELAHSHGGDAGQIAETLSMSERNVRRIFHDHGLSVTEAWASRKRPVVAPRVRASEPPRTASEPPRRREVPAHPVYAWCVCPDCSGSKKDKRRTRAA